MRVGKLAVAVMVVSSLMGLSAPAQQADDLEALLSDIGGTAEASNAQPAVAPAAAADVTEPPAPTPGEPSTDPFAGLPSDTVVDLSAPAEGQPQPAVEEATAAEPAAAPEETSDPFASEPVAEPVVSDMVVTETIEPAPESPAVEAAVEPVVSDMGIEPTATETPPELMVTDAPVEPVAEEAAESVTEAATEPAVEPAAEPVVEPVAEAAAAAEAPAAEDVSLDSLLAIDEAAAGTEVAPTEAPVQEETMVESVEVTAEPVIEATEPAMSDLMGEAPAEELVAEEVVVVEEVEVQPEEEAVPEKPSKAGKEATEKPVSMKEAKAIAQQEEVRRQAQEVQALKSLEAGYKLLTEGNYGEAVKSFEDARANLPERPATFEQREQARWGLAEAQYRMAMDIYKKKGDMADARQYAERSLKNDPEHKGVAPLIEKIAREDYRQGLPIPPSKSPTYLNKKAEINKLTKEGIQYFDIKEYSKAEAVFENVLLMDEFNVPAMKYLKRIEELRFKISTKERDATVAGLMRQVRDSWNPPIRDEVKLPEELVGRGVVETKTATQRLQERMTKIIIPSIEFRQANITDVITFLSTESVKLDPEEIGVNIILNLNIPGQEGAAAAPSQVAAPMAEDPFASLPPAGGEFGGSALPMETAASAGKTITLSLRRISMLDAIKYLTEVAGLKYRIEDNAVIITPANVPSGRVITRMYPVQPSILDVIIQKEDVQSGSETRGGSGEFIQMGGAASVKRSDVKDFFEKAGVPFPVGTSITYNQSISQLIVANTPDNLEIFERILQQLNVIPNQVEIEARFIEVGQNDLEELGFQWILNDNWEIAQNKNSGMGMLGGTERVQVDKDSQGFTKGLRYFGFDSGTAAISPVSTVSKNVNQAMMGGILSFSSILTNPEVSLVIQALSQHGGTDLLSAPRVTTRSGVNAVIQVVREIIYPTEFEVTQPTVQSQGDLVTPPTVTPGSFQTRETGVILNVTPTVGPDGYTIDLTMVPEVCELVDWIEYGSSITLDTGAVGARQTRTYQFKMPQPVFSSRNVTTSIVIWDGQTVVMGGLIREELVTMKDKVPFLGDIPLLGRLFRSEGQQSKKMNLLIFVTARLVDPAGKPIHKAEAMAMPGGSAATTPVGADAAVSR